MVSGLAGATTLGVSTDTLLSWKSQIVDGELVTLPPDTVERIGLLLVLQKSLVSLTPSGHESLAAEWFQKPISLWGITGDSIRSHLLKDPRTEVLAKMAWRVKSAIV